MEERLKFLANGTKPRKNKEVMGEVIDELKKEGLYYGDKTQGEGDEKKDKKSKKRKHSEVQEDSDDSIPEEKA